MQKFRYMIAGGLLGLGLLFGVACAAGGLPEYSKEDIVSVGGIFYLPREKYITDFYITRSYDRNGDDKPDIVEYRHLRPGVPTMGAEDPHQICFSEPANSDNWKCVIGSNTEGKFDKEVPPTYLWAVDGDHKVVLTNIRLRPFSEISKEWIR